MTAEKKKPYDEAAATAIRRLLMAATYFRQTQCNVRVAVYWPEDDPQYVFRWNAEAYTFEFAEMVDDEHWVLVSGALAAPAHPSVQDPFPIFATLRMIPELYALAIEARDRALAEVQAGGAALDAWITEVTTPPEPPPAETP